jgi:hypothetical protein
MIKTSATDPGNRSADATPELADALCVAMGGRPREGKPKVGRSPSAVGRSSSAGSPRARAPVAQSGGRTVETTRTTPLTSRADRGDERVRLIEEAVLLIRGEWPGVACGLCETVNRATGLFIAPPGALDETIERTADEAIRVVEGLYGREAAFEVRRLAAIDPRPKAASGLHGTRRHRWFGLPSLPRMRFGARPG